MATDPILIDCVGSGQAGHLMPTGLMLCSMCGSAMAPLPGGVMQDHQRRDLVAMVKRGDFDG